MFFKSSIKLGCVLISLFANQAFSDTWLLHYDIFGDNRVAGQMTQRIMVSDRGYAFAEISQFSLRGWWGQFSLNSYNFEIYDIQWQLLHAVGISQDGGTVHLTETTLDGKNYFAEYRYVDDITDAEGVKLIELANLIRSSVEIESNALVQTFDGLFEQGPTQIQSGSFSKDAFDVTFNQLLNKSDWQRSDVTIYDTENLTIANNDIRVLDIETTDENERFEKLTHLILTDEQDSVSEIWFAHSPPPHLVRLKTSEDGMHIELRLANKQQLSTSF